MRVPVVPSLRHYQRAWLQPDLIAGLTLLVIAVPEQLATSRLAGMPAATALWAFVAATVAFAVLGSNPQLSVGADSTIAPLFAAGLVHYAPLASPHYVALVTLTALVTGAVLTVVGLLRLGWIADLLSTPIIAGFLCGVAVIILVHQLPDFLGISPPSGSTVHRIHVIADNLSHTNGWALGIGAAVLAVVVAAERLDKRIPGALIGLVGSTGVVVAAHLRAHGVNVLGHVSAGLPHLGLSGVTGSDIGRVLPVALVVAVVCLGQTAATTRAFATSGGYDVDVDGDFLGVGVANLLAGAAGTFPVDASPARTGVVADAGGRSQLGALLAVAVVAAASPAAGVLQNVPLATLAAILLFVASRLVHWRDLVAIAHFDRYELALAVITTVAVAAIGVEQGIAVAVLLAVLDRTRLSARPHTVLLGRLPGTTSWAPSDGREAVRPVPGIVVLLYAGPLYFANAGEFRKVVTSAMAKADEPVRALVLDAAAMSDIDFTGAMALAGVVRQLHRQSVAFAVARPGADVPRNLRASGLVELIGTDRIFDTVDEAVTALKAAEPHGP